MKTLFKKINIFVLLLFITLTAFVATETIIVNAEYIEMDQELRAAWVSPWGGDSGLVTYKSEESFKKNMTYILDTLEMYNMNTIIYHVRTHNNALYPSELNPVSSYFSKANFDTFDPLEWMITETHKRGIEFHAWLNPYRVKSSSSKSLETIASEYKDYPANPASDPNNMLLGDGTTILNPGLQNVRDFIVDTCIELMENYDVDAIHFDDYFYCDMGASGKTSGTNSILTEPDQGTYEAYIDANPDCTYSKTNGDNKADWRREQVDLFIEQLHYAMDDFNKKNNRYVQLGIAPTGIYKNGNGNVTYNEDGTANTNGSNTRGQTHYSSYLFCNTLKWVNEEWIDYIMPQSYWASSHPSAHYYEVMGWWNKVVQNRDVNLYSGIGLYMADSSGNTYSWQTNENELNEQLELVASLDRVDGVSFYNFNTLRKARDGNTTMSVTQINNSLNKDKWQNVVPPAEIRSFGKVQLGAVKNLILDKNGEYNKISFNALENAKFYCIYRSENELTYSASECVDIIGGDEEEFISWVDDNKGDYQYGVKALSYTNTLGLGTSTSGVAEGQQLKYETIDAVVSDLILDYNKTMNKKYTLNDFVKMVESNNTGFNMFAGLEGTKTFFNNKENLSKWKWLLQYCEAKRTANSLDSTVYKEMESFGYVSKDAVIINMELLAFITGNKSYQYSTYKTSDYSRYNRSDYVDYCPFDLVKEKTYVVTFLDWNEDLISKQYVLEGKDATLPTIYSRTGYALEKWTDDYKNITKDTVIKAVYTIDDSFVTYTIHNGDLANPIQDAIYLTDEENLKVIMLPKNSKVKIKANNNLTGGSRCQFGTFITEDNMYECVAINSREIEIKKTDDYQANKMDIYVVNKENDYSVYFSVVASDYGTVKKVGAIYTKNGTNPIENSCFCITETETNNTVLGFTLQDNEIYNVVFYAIININGYDIYVYSNSINIQK